MWNQLNRIALLSLVLLLGLNLAGCEADADHLTEIVDGIAPVDPDDGSDDPGTGNEDTGFPNTGSAGGTILDGDTQIVGGDSGKHFICTESASAEEGAVAEAAAYGLVGGALTDLLNVLGGDSLSELLAAVVDLPYVVDNNMQTASAFTLTVSALGQTVTALAESVVMPDAVPANGENYAVFAISFPEALLGLSLFESVEMSTYLNGEEQEPAVSITAANLDLLGFSVGTEQFAFIGRRVTLPYDTVEIRMNAPLLSLDLGAALFVHEMCVRGTLVDAPTS